MSYDKLKKQVFRELQEMATAAASIQKYSNELPSTVALKQQRIITEAMASNLHSFYTGAERIFLKIAREIDRSEPSGESWHRELLAQMFKESLEVREAVISNPKLKADLDDLRKFRHVFRTHYAHELQEDLVLERAKSVLEIYRALEQDLQNFLRSHQSN